jgi:hypothetical protein
MSKARKSAWTLLAIIMAVAAVRGDVDTAARGYAQDALARALVTFAVARTLNGLISTAQGTELSLEPGGIGVNFSIGEILDPINDLIERFSSVMLVASSSLGLQNLFLAISAWWGIDLLLVVTAAVTLAALWVPAATSVLGSYAVRWLVLAAMLRFAVPAFAIFSNVVFETFLAEDQQAAVQALETTGNEIETFNEEVAPPATEDPTFVEQLGSLIGDSLRSLNARERLENLRTSASQATEHIVNLIVIFVFQTIVLPLAFLWMAAEILKAVIARGVGN